MLKLFAATLLLGALAIPALAAAEKVLCPRSDCSATCCTQSDKNRMTCHNPTTCGNAEKPH